MPYRDNGDGSKDPRTFYAYSYGFSLDPAKTVRSLSLPADDSVKLLAATADEVGSPRTPPARPSLPPLLGKGKYRKSARHTQLPLLGSDPSLTGQGARDERGGVLRVPTTDA